jgi:hypothetical protein
MLMRLLKKYADCEIVMRRSNRPSIFGDPASPLHNQEIDNQEIDNQEIDNLVVDGELEEFLEPADESYWPAIQRQKQRL